jgi:hypothetical protein
MEENTPESLLDMHLDYDGGHRLLETVRWSRFLSISGMVCIGLFTLALVIAGPKVIALYEESYPGLENFVIPIIILFLLLMGTLGVLVFMLYRFSIMTRKGIEGQDQGMFNQGLKGLKTYFLISGVMAILGLLFNILTLSSLF